MKVYILTSNYYSEYEDVREFIDVFKTKELAEKYIDLIIEKKKHSREEFLIEEREIIEKEDHDIYHIKEKKYLTYDGKEFKNFSLNNFTAGYGIESELFHGKENAMDEYWEKTGTDEQGWKDYLRSFYKLDFEQREREGVKTSKDFIQTTYYLKIYREEELGKEEIEKQWKQLMNEIIKKREKEHWNERALKEFVRGNKK